LALLFIRASPFLINFNLGAFLVELVARVLANLFDATMPPVYRLFGKSFLKLSCMPEESPVHTRTSPSFPQIRINCFKLSFGERLPLLQLSVFTYYFL
jgi:hypothetical protein